MALKPNQHYFNLSKNSAEQLETRYMHLSADCHLDTYVEYTNTIKDYIATIKTLEALGKNTDDIYESLHALSKSKYFGKSEFACFINACDCTYDIVKKGDITLLKTLVQLYLHNRDITNCTPKEWIQAIIDKGASRADGKIGETKLVNIATQQGFKLVNTWKDFKAQQHAVAIFSKAVFNADTIQKNLGIQLQFHAQNKMLDIILKSGSTIVFIEAKHMKESGGSQDKQVKELIDIIKESSPYPNVKFCAFLDGLFSNKLLSIPTQYTKENKLSTQQREIISTLQSNQHSYWVNTAGYKEFIKDLYS